MILKKMFTAVLVLSCLSTYAQSDAVWEKAINAWESSSNIKAGYCVKYVHAGAKGFSSDFNTEGGSLEGDIAYIEDGKYRINTVKFVNKGEEYILDEPKLSKDTFPDVNYIKENLIFAKANQKYLEINKINEKNSAIMEYKIIAKIPDYPEFQAIAFSEAATGNPIKVGIIGCGLICYYHMSQ